ncbi:MAG: protoporphyrinogen oxidase HemJ [Alphaproteobacteria bacterium]|nr:protoporphyrinogen oxidase HemJ [Alphaproteobacteria bacterium]
MDYQLVKAFHIIAIIAWMAGLLYLPRLFVYHSLVDVGSVRSQTFKLMERRLLKGIMNPAMIISWLLGLYLLHLNPSLLKEYWMISKIVCVVLMTYFHMKFSGMRRRLEADETPKPDKYYRYWNEAPTLTMIAIVILAVVEPF